MTKTLTLALVLCSGLHVLAQDSDSTYVDRVTGITVPVPSGWTIERLPEKEGLVKLYPSGKDEFKTASFEISGRDPSEEILSGKVSAEDVIKLFSKEFTKSFDAFELVSSDSLRYGDHLVIVLNYKCTTGGVKLKVYENDWFTKKRHYQLFGFSTEELYEKQAPKFEKIAKGFQCEEATSTELEDPSLDYAELVRSAKSANGDKEYDDAIAAAKKALRAKAENKWEAYHQLGFAFFYKGDYATGAKYYMTALEANPESETALLDCLEALMCAERGAETRSLVENYREKSFLESARDQTLLAYLDVASFVIDGEFRTDLKGFKKKLNAYATKAEELEGKVDHWDSSGTEAFIEKNVKGKKAKAILEAIHQLLKWTLKPAQFRETVDKILGD